MKQNVLESIKSRFASLQLKVRKAMEAQLIKVDDVHQFLVSFFQSNCRIPEVPDLTKMFNFLSETKLWNYNSYGALKKMVEEFIPNNGSVNQSMTDYREKLPSYFATIKIIDFVNPLEDDNSEVNFEDESDEHIQLTFSPKQYKPKFGKLRIRLKLEKKLTEITLAHVNTLWQSLCEEFDLPPLSTVLDKIIAGSVIITWLILPSIAEKITRSASKALKFYQHHSIVEVDIDDEPLYKEEWIVSL